MSGDVSMNEDALLAEIAADETFNDNAPATRQQGRRQGAQDVHPFDYEFTGERYVYDPKKTKDDPLPFYERQYFHVYATRLEYMRDRIIKSAAAQIDEDIEHTTASDAPIGQRVLVLGITVKRMANRESVLQGLDAEEEDQEIAVGVNRIQLESLASDKDFVELEDEHKQITRLNKIDIGVFTTGMALGIVGVKQADYTFDVEQIIYPAMPPPRPEVVLDADCYVLFLSGLRADHLTFVERSRLLISISNKMLDKPYAGNLARVVFAGDTAVTFCECEECNKTNINDPMPLGRHIDPAVQIIDQLGNRVFNLFKRFDVDIMPGDLDPASLMWPQQPMPRGIFEPFIVSQNDPNLYDIPDTLLDAPRAGKKWEKVGGGPVRINKENTQPAGYGIYRKPSRQLHSVTNPYSFAIKGLHFLGTSGANVNSIRRLTVPGRSPLDIMKQIIELGHLAPSAPDHLDCFPFSGTDKRDIFALDELPDVFFVGNQPTYASETITAQNGQKVHLISLPTFADTKTAVIFNLRTRESQLLRVL